MIAPRRRPGPEVGLTPMIDVLFLVLMFLLLTTTFKEFTFLQVTLPEAATGVRDRRSLATSVRIVIDQDGRLLVRDQAVTLDVLAGTLATLADKEAANVQIAADARVGHGQVVAVMDAIRRAGIHRVSIETWSVDDGGRPGS